MVVRFFLLSTHYRSPIDFDDERLQFAQRGLERLRNAYAQLEYGLKNAGSSENGAKLIAATKNAQEQFVQAMNDDFNTALAIAALFDLARDINTYSSEKELDKDALAGAKKVFEDLMGVIGINLAVEQGEKGQILEGLMELIIEIRQTARKNKDFTTADLIRDKLKELGVILEDAPQGTKWKINS
jgi:cysteinyl-tRNA synthetase